MANAVDNLLEEVKINNRKNSTEISKVLYKIISFLILMAIFLVPLWFLPFTNDVLDFNKQVLLIVISSLGLFLYLIDIVKSGIASYTKSSLFLPLISFLIAVLIGSIFSVISTQSLFGIGLSQALTLTSTIVFVIFFFLALHVGRENPQKLIIAFISGLTLTYIIGILQLIGLSVFRNTQFTDIGFNTIGSVNALGMLSAITLPLFLTKIHFQSSKLENIYNLLRFIGAIASVSILSLINWLPLWIVAISGMLLYLVFIAMAGNIKNRVRVYAIPMFIIILGVGLSLMKIDIANISSSLPIEASPTHQTTYNITKEVLKTRPLGYGPENFGIAYDLFKPETIGNTFFFQTRFNNATSEFGNIAIEIGVLGMIAFIFILIEILRILIRAIKNSFFGKYIFSSVGASMGALIVGFFLYPFAFALWFAFFILLALASIYDQNYTNENVQKVINLEVDSKYSFIGSLAFIIGLVLILVGGYFTVNRYRANVFLAQALNTSEQHVAIPKFVSAYNLNSGDTRTGRLLSQVILTKLSKELAKGPNEGESQEEYRSRINNQIDSATRFGITTTETNPADSQNWMNRGLVYQNLIGLGIDGSGPFAVSMYNEALNRNPVNPQAYLRIGNTYVGMARQIIQSQTDADAQEKFKDYLTLAEKNFQKAIGLYNNYGQALINLAVVYDLRGQIPQAIKQLERLISTNPRDPSIAFQLGLLYYRNNQKTDAINAWEHSVRLFPDYSNARWYLSLAYEEKGDIEQALRQVKEIEKHNSDNNLVIERILRLQSGQTLIPPVDLLDQEPLN